PIYTLYFGFWPAVVLHGFDVVKRGPLPIIKDSQKGCGLIFTIGERWRLLRCFSLMTLKNFGMGKRSLEERVQEEAPCLVEELQKMEEPFDPTFILACAPHNVIWDILNKNAHRVNSVWCQMYNLWPTFMKYIPGKHKEVLKRLDDVKVFILEKVK
ncbi:Cytochrome P450 2C44, partial [Lemmus lemmus]